jgi:tetratricopeptide (TPR) repeat protein
MATAGSHTGSPWFARRASERMEAGDIAEAARLCLEGSAEYPWYATGPYILGRCYELLGRTAEAIVEYRRAVALVPDSAMVREALSRAERHEEGSFEAFAVQQAAMLNRTPGSVTFEEFVAGDAGGAESSADFLRKKAEEARHEESRAAAEAEQEASPPPPRQIVTVTLAEIYAAQGEYGEAMAAYRILMERQPGEAEGYRKRIRELERLAAAATEKPLE